MITEATTADWVDFWENEMPPEPVSLDAKQLASLKEEILEQVSIAASVWDWTEFEENALCSLISDIFVDRGIL